uniref:Uncharacterized protein n=1 Tax=Aegilops tauschii subsp. strangulata TaxID=200361 RepID=A0A453DGF1_AEGTS
MGVAASLCSLADKKHGARDDGPSDLHGNSGEGMEREDQGPHQQLLWQVSTCSDSWTVRRERTQFVIVS